MERSCEVIHITPGMFIINIHMGTSYQPALLSHCYKEEFVLSGFKWLKTCYD